MSNSEQEKINETIEYLKYLPDIFDELYLIRTLLSDISESLGNIEKNIYDK